MLVLRSDTGGTLSRKDISKLKMKKELDLLRDIIFPACAIFCVIVFVFFLGAHIAGVNVTESETERIITFDNSTGENIIDTDTPNPDALPVQTLFGLLLFSIALVAFGQLFKLNYSKLLLRFAHFILTLLAFFVFVLALPGYITDTGFAAALVDTLAIAVLYFVILGIKTLVMLPLRKLPLDRFDRIKKVILPTFTVFTLIVFGISIFNLISQVSVIVTEIIDQTFIHDDVIQTTYVKVVTPLAPTLQNYFRYLLTGLVVMLGYMVLKLNINKALKILFNFIIYTVGYVGIWVIGMDYFRLIPSNTLPAVIIYLAVYAVVLITVCVINAVNRRQNEEIEDYESQFSLGVKTSRRKNGR